MLNNLFNFAQNFRLMKKYFLLIVFSLLIFPLVTDAQAWKRNPSSIIFGTGTNNFMGDLGGGKKSAAHFMGVRDLDYQVTRPTWQVGYRYRFHEYFTFRTGFSYALVSGSDAASGSLDRQARNLSFRSGVYELSAQVEYYFIKEKGVAKSSFGSLKGFSPLSAYIFLGGGGFYFNPKSKHPETGEWIALQPLGTEGQYANADGTPYIYEYQGTNYSTPEPYKKFAGMVSMGVGIKYDLNKQWSLGFEISNRYSSTDYLDDTHDRYFNYAEMGLTPPSEYTSVFWNRSYNLVYENDAIVGLEQTPGTKVTGELFRGNPNYNDAYIFALITVYYKLGGGSSAKPKYR